MSDPSSYSAIYAFGDSLSDAGNVSIVTAPAGRIPVSPPYYEQSYGPLGALTATVFSNGPTWVQDLSGLLGLGTLSPSLYGGTDFAYGGAETGANTGSSFTGLELSAISLPSQLTQFEARVPSTSSGALYTVSIGTNDLYAILTTAGLSLSEMLTQVSAAVSSEVSFASDLIGRGARNLLALDAPDLGKVPVVTQRNDPAEDALASRLSNLYNIGLNAALENLAQAHGVNLSILPTYSLLDQAVADPSRFGLTNATNPVWSGNFTASNSGTLATTDPTQQNQYLFWDHYHPTAHVHALVASDAQSLVTTGSPLYPAPTVRMKDTTTGVSSTQFGQIYYGPVAGLQGQFLYPGQDNVALSATEPGMYLAGGSGEDAIAALSGSNVLDGGGGSNFLAGATGADGGRDTFFLDGRGGQTAWDTLVNFHRGDAVTLWGFVPGSSALSWADNEGAAGYTGATLHVAFAGAGTPVNGSVTFAGIPLAEAQSRFSISSGTVGGIPYLYVSSNA